MRGHIRNSFENDVLLNFVKKIAELNELKIFIHTWNIVQSNISWRRIVEIRDLITEERILSYFKDIKHLIKFIKIDDDNKIEIQGRITGNIGHTPCPVLGYKNMYYGKLVVCEHVFKNVDKNESAVQMRFDILSNPYSDSIKNLLKFIHLTSYQISQKTNKEEIIFLNNKAFVGIDNIYMSNVVNMYRFVRYMYSNMDSILERNPTVRHQEFLAYFERNNFQGDPSLKKTVICQLETLMSDQIENKELVISEKAIDKIKLWNKKGIKLIILTRKDESLRDSIEKQLSKLQIQYDNLLMNINEGYIVTIGDKYNNKIINVDKGIEDIFI